MKLHQALVVGAVGATLSVALPAHGQAIAYMGEVQLYANDFCPRGTGDANGTLLAVSTNQALFALLGTTFGGNGSVTFALPDLRGRKAIGEGQGPGTSNFVRGQMAGVSQMTLIMTNLPQHTHGGHLVGVDAGPNSDAPADGVLADFQAGTNVYNNTVPPSVPMAFSSVTIDPQGGSQPYGNMKPYLAMRYCVVMTGIFPSPS